MSKERERPLCKQFPPVNPLVEIDQVDKKTGEVSRAIVMDNRLASNIVNLDTARLLDQQFNLTNNPELTYGYSKISPKGENVVSLLGKTARRPLFPFNGYEAEYWVNSDKKIKHVHLTVSSNFSKETTSQLENIRKILNNAFGQDVSRSSIDKMKQELYSLAPVAQFAPEKGLDLLIDYIRIKPFDTKEMHRDYYETMNKIESSELGSFQYSGTPIDRLEIMCYEILIDLPDFETLKIGVIAGINVRSTKMDILHNHICRAIERSHFPISSGTNHTPLIETIVCSIINPYSRIVIHHRVDDLMPA